ncbi:MAG TPA: hypothetical protein VD788_01465 [Candidatus Polarisedimenticolaceae bacterium]|nr:hypothetical protein [Candidatus Polarisedimenticolaceae bacterium]
MVATYRFRVLDVAVALCGPDEVLRPIVRAYGRFRVSEANGSPPSHRIRLEGLEADSFLDGGETVPRIRGASLTLQLYERFLNAIFDRVSSHAVLHAGALVDGRGRALLISGPSGFGKTSLTLELLGRGLRFLSDDYAPLELASGRIQPYPRTIGLLPDGAIRAPERFAEAAADPALPRLLGKALIDVGEVLGEQAIAGEPAPVGDVVVLDASGPARDDRRSIVQFGVWPRGVADCAREIAGIPGVVVLGRHDRADITVWQVALDESKLPTPRFSQLLERDFIAYSEVRPSVTPDFAAPPRLAPLTRREAALSLCREIQNRRPRGRLMQSYGGDTTALFLDVAERLAPARCHRLEVGALRPTADLIERLARGTG